MWRRLPAAVFVTGAALVLIAGATGDLQSWSDSLQSQSWRSAFDAPEWNAVAEVWQAGAARLQAFLPHRASPAADSATSPPVQPAQQGAARPLVQQATQSAANVSVSPAAAAPAALTQREPSPHQRLLDARQALAAGRSGEAQQMLEQARSQMLVRPEQHAISHAESIDLPATWVSRALLSLRSGDQPGALHDIDLAIASS